MHFATVAESNLVFGRVGIRIYRRRIHGQTDYVGRVAAVKQNVAIGMPSCVRQCLVADTSTVNEPILHVGLTAIKSWQAKPAGHRDAVIFCLKMDGILRKSLAENPGQALQAFVICPRRSQLQHGTPIVRQRQCNVRTRECESLDPFFDMAEFGSLSLQEATPRRCVVKQIVDFDGCADRMCGRRNCRRRRRVRVSA